MMTLQRRKRTRPGRSRKTSQAFHRNIPVHECHDHAENVTVPGGPEMRRCAVCDHRWKP